MFFTYDYWILGLPSINHSNHELRVTAAATLLFFLLTSTPHAAAQPQSPTDDNYYSPRFNPSMGVVIIILISALFVMGFVSMYIRSCSEDASSSTNVGRAVTGRSRRGPRGLEPTIIESFPTFEYAAVKSLHLGKDALECAICLNEFEDDETLRLIPKCDHVFHPECIGEWLAAHTTCPVCRTDLTPVPGESILAVPTLPSELAQICEHGHPHSDDNLDGIASQQNGAEVMIQVVDEPVHLASSTVVSEKRDQQGVNYSYPVPSERDVANFSAKRLNRNRTRKWLGAMFTRSNSTGHVAVKQWENMDRFTLRIPDDVRKQIISGKLNRTTSCLALPAGEGSSRRGYRYGEGSSSRAGRRYYGDRGAAATKSDRWVFSLMPPFFSRASSLRSRRAGSRSVSRRSAGGSVRSNRDDGSVKGDSVRGGSVGSNRDDESVKGDSLHGSIRSNRGDEPGLPPV